MNENEWLNVFHSFKHSAIQLMICDSLVPVYKVRN